MTLSRRGARALGALAAALLMPAAVVVSPPAHATPHHVRYSVTSSTPVYAYIYYRDTDPPTFVDYSHDPYRYSPRIEADIGPGKPWVLDVTLQDPDQWAMVTATSGDSNVTTPFQCQLSVDGAVVVSSNGPKGALCSLRTW